MHFLYFHLLVFIFLFITFLLCFEVIFLDKISLSRADGGKKILSQIRRNFMDPKLRNDTAAALQKHDQNRNKLCSRYK